MAKGTGGTIRPGSIATHEGCNVPIESAESVLAESYYSMNDPIEMWPGGPVVEGSPLPPKQTPVSYDWTFQPCGHTVRHYVESDEALFTMVSGA